MITFKQIKESKDIKTYIERADISLNELGYTEHSFAHVGIVAKLAGDLLKSLKYDQRTIELTQIAAYMHDIGNVINRIDILVEPGDIFGCQFFYFQHHFSHIFHLFS